MSEKKPVALIGRLAVQLKLISSEQLSQALAEQSRSKNPRLGEIFVEQGFIDSKQLAKLVSVQDDVIAKHRAKKAVAAGGSAPTEERQRREPTAPGGEASPSAASSKKEVLLAAAQAARDASPVTSAIVEEIAQPPPEAAAHRPAPDPAPQRQAVAPPQAAKPASPASPPPQADRPVAAPVAAADDGPQSLELTLPDPDPADRQRLEQILAEAVQAGASDIHFHSGGAVKLRIHGSLAKKDDAALDRDQAERLVAASLSPAERAELCRDGELDFCLEVAGVGRFRANTYRQQRGMDVVFRSIPSKPPTLEELGLPAELGKYTDYHQGMVLITGPAGCGKSATMAALVNMVNESRDDHILTIEDPIETIHTSKRCLVNQRHAGRHTDSFARALRGALREDPDVIVIGELRDLETISLAMTAAETGHFVLATLHTNNAVRTINRIIGAFPSNEQGQVRTMLSESLRAVISQRLVPTADGSGRVPALEVLVINKAIGNMIRDEKTVQIRSSIQTGKAHGMYLLEQSLNELVQQGRITRDKALEFAEEKKLITAGG
jgi:twitching motility protein PilT